MNKLARTLRLYKEKRLKTEEELLKVMEKAGLTERLGADRLFPEERIRQTSTMRAVEAAYRLLGDRCETCAWRGMQDLTVITPVAKPGAG